MRRLRSKLTLEDYICFFHNPDVQRYSNHQIQEILSINGFCQLENKRKVEEDLDTVELINPKRSTLLARAMFPLAPLTVDEVKDDLGSIGWEACPIGSILAVGSAAEKEDKVKKQGRRKRTKLEVKS